MAGNTGQLSGVQCTAYGENSASGMHCGRGDGGGRWESGKERWVPVLRCRCHCETIC